MRPLADRVLVKRLSEEKVSPSGLVMIQQDLPWEEGIVLAVGSGRMLECGRRVEPEVRVGDRVMMSRRSWVPVEGGFIVREDEILAVVE